MSQKPEKIMIEKTNDQLLQTLTRQQRIQLFEKGLFSDFTIICGGKDGENEEEKFQVHRAILAARSPYFKAMLTNTACKEAQTGVMKIEDFGAEPIRLFLAFIYSGEKPKVLPLDQLKDMFRAADMYQVDELKKLCEHRLAKRLNLVNALELLAFANFYVYSAEKLKREAIRFVNANKATLASGELWKEFVLAHPDILEQLYLAI